MSSPSGGWVGSGGTLGSAGSWRGDALPGEGEVEAGISGFEGEILVDFTFLYGELEVD